MKSRHLKTLREVFDRPTRSNIVFSEMETLVLALGGNVVEREGARIKIVIKGAVWRAHRPHPGKEAKKYQVEEFRELLEFIGVTPQTAGERE
ncbi:MAG: type II toxin-antitoxin system HicA family toxin [Betaproteobacteria bacterium]|nr:type II toxin-antitoxin system HicA family toxin [Betaproteobacteria bacterium]